MLNFIRRESSAETFVAYVGKRPTVKRVNLVKTLSLLALACTALPAAAQTVFTDSFESGNLSHTQGGIKWASSANVSVYSGFGHTGSHCLKFAYPAGSPAVGSTAEQRFNLGANYPELYLEWYAYYPNGTEGLGPRFVHEAASPGNDKFLRLWSGNQSDGNDGYSQFTVKAGASTDVGGVAAGDEKIFAEYGENMLGVGPFGTTGSQPSSSFQSFITDSYRGRWIDIKVHVKAASSANNDGVIQIWRDGVQIVSATNLPTYPSGGAGNYYNFGYLLGWANAGFAQATNVYIDDVTFSTTSSTATSGGGGGSSTTAVPEPPASVTVQ
jgi:hypothetical protein